MARAGSTITLTLSFGLGAFLPVGGYVLMQELETLQIAPGTSVYQCETIGPGHSQDFRKHCILGVLEMSGRENIISCCP